MTHASSPVPGASGHAGAPTSSTLTPATTGAAAAAAALHAGRPLRLLMGPVGYVGVGALDIRSSDAAMLAIGDRCRWVYELNGYTGACGVDCWHASPEAALACFVGRRASS